MVKHPRARLGDVLYIPIVADKFSFAQVYAKTKLLYLGVYPGIHQGTPEISKVNFVRPAFAGWTADAEIYFGRWRIIGNLPIVDADDVRKEYLVTYASHEWVESFEGVLLHQASKDEEKRLSKRSSYSPAAFEHIIRAFNGLEDWRHSWDRLVVT